MPTPTEKYLAQIFKNIDLGGDYLQKLNIKTQPYVSSLIGPLGIVTIPNSYVAIGLNTPLSRLHVNGDIRADNYLLQNGSPAFVSLWSQSGSSIYYNSGNVGIGTSSPAKPLHVSTNNNDTTMGVRVSNDNVGGRSGLSFNLPNNSNEYYSIGIDNDRVFKIANGTSLTSNTRMSFTPIGNVLIGTTTDSGYKLDVNGSARTGNLTIGSLVSDNVISFGGGVNTNIFRSVSDNSLNYRNNFSSTVVHRFITNSNLPNTNTSGNNTFVSLPIGFAPTSGTGTWAQLSMTHLINQTGGANGITRGVYINPTLTSAADYRAIETTAGKVIHQGLTNATQSDVVYYNSTTGELTYGVAPASTGFIGLYDSQGSTSYCGIAPFGSLTSDPVWKVTKIIVNLDGSTTVTVANNIAWDNRLTETYV